MIETSPIRAVVVEDSAGVREHLESLLLESRCMVPVGAAATVSEAVRVIEKTKPDVVFLDVFLRGGTGLDVLRQLRSIERSCQAAVMTSDPSEPLRAACLRLGARWFIDKTELNQAITVICQEWRTRNKLTGSRYN